MLTVLIFQHIFIFETRQLFQDFSMAPWCSTFGSSTIPTTAPPKTRHFSTPLLSQVSIIFFVNIFWLGICKSYVRVHFHDCDWNCQVCSLQFKHFKVNCDVFAISFERSVKQSFLLWQFLPRVSPIASSVLV
jgi:hypothetical protein